MTVGGCGFGSVFLRQPTTFRIRIHAQHMTAGRFQQLHRELSQQPQADDRHAMAQFHTGHPHRLQRDAAQRHKGGLFKRHALRDWHAQVARDAHHLGVAGVAAARTGDPISDAVRARACPSPHAAAHVQYHAGRGVAQGHGRFQAGHGLAIGLQQPFGAALVHHLLHPVRSGQRLAQQTLPGDVNHGPFGTHADQRGPRLHQHLPPPGMGWCRHLGQL